MPLFSLDAGCCKHSKKWVKYIWKYLLTFRSKISCKFAFRMLFTSLKHYLNNSKQYWKRGCMKTLVFFEKLTLDIKTSKWHDNLQVRQIKDDLSLLSLRCPDMVTVHYLKWSVWDLGSAKWRQAKNKKLLCSALRRKAEHRARKRKKGVWWIAREIDWYDSLCVCGADWAHCVLSSKWPYLGLAEGISLPSVVFRQTHSVNHLKNFIPGYPELVKYHHSAMFRVTCELLFVSVLYPLPLKLSHWLARSILHMSQNAF